MADSSIFDIHELALARFPDLAVTLADDADVEDNEDAIGADDVEVEDEDLDFDTNTEDKRVVSKRLKRHGRKGRKGRDKNPYEDSDMPTGAVGVHINSGGKKKANPRDKRRGPQLMG